MEIVMKNIGELTPYEKNPRVNDDAVEKVAQSIKEFGFKVPLVIDKNGVIITGHTRYKACQQLGIKQIPCIVADDLSEKQIKAYRLADNKVSDYSIWDNKLLLEELEDLNFDIFTGFDESELFEDIKELTELDEKDNEVIDNNDSGIVYSITFKTQDKKLLQQIKDIVEANNEEIYE